MPTTRKVGVSGWLTFEALSVVELLRKAGPASSSSVRCGGGLLYVRRMGADKVKRRLAGGIVDGELDLRKW